MADRQRVVRATGRKGAVTITLPPRTTNSDLTPPPPGPWPDSPSPTDHSTVNSHKRGSRASERMQTFNGAQGVVPVLYGGTISVGGYIIFQKQVGVYLYLDLALSMGEILDCGTPKWNRQYTAAAVGADYYNHTGAPGDTTMSLINAVDALYAVPDGLAHVELRIHTPVSTTPAFNPLDIVFETAAGRLLYDPRTATVGWSTNPVLVVYDMLTNTKYGRGLPASRLFTQDWMDEADYCDSDPGDGLKTWEFSWRIDTRDQIDSQINFVLAHCSGHLRDVNGKIGIWLDRLRDRTLDAASNPIVYSDNDDRFPANTAGEITWSSRPREQVPNVVIVEYTDNLGGDEDSSTQVPKPADLDPALDWIETRLRLPGINKIDMADRRGTLEFNMRQLDKDIIIPAWQSGLLSVPGDRIGIDSRLLIPSGTAPSNIGATNGIEEVVVVDQKISDVITLRCALYREATYGPVTTPGVPPTPGDPPEGSPPPVPPGSGGGVGSDLAYIQNLSLADYELGAQSANFSITDRGRIGMLALGSGAGLDWSGETQLDDYDLSSLGMIYTVTVNSANVLLTGLTVNGDQPFLGDVVVFQLDDVTGGSLTIQHDNGVDSFADHRFQNVNEVDLVLTQKWQAVAYRYLTTSTHWRILWRNF